MLVDTHCHINIMVKDGFDSPLQPQHFEIAEKIVSQAAAHNITHIVNVGTSVIESENCIALAKKFSNLYATVGIHPGDCTATWLHDLKKIKELLKQKKENKIVGIGETGLDFHYPGIDKQRQSNAFRAQIELALEHDLTLVIHTRQATDETLQIVEEFKSDLKSARGIFHCFSEDLTFADHVIKEFGFMLGIGGAVTYPKNETLRTVVKNIPSDHLLLETDAPFLPPQIIRGKKNHPLYIETIAHYIADLRGMPFEECAQRTTANAFSIYDLENPSA